MAHAYPYRFEPQEAGGVLVQFIDVPETYGLRFNTDRFKSLAMRADTSTSCCIRELNTLRVGYREYIDNLARPAFAQELTYPIHLDAPTEIRFKSVRIEVLTADASEITYRVFSGF